MPEKRWGCDLVASHLLRMPSQVGPVSMTELRLVSVRRMKLSNLETKHSRMQKSCDDLARLISEIGAEIEKDAVEIRRKLAAGAEIR